MRPLGCVTDPDPSPGLGSFGFNGSRYLLSYVPPLSADGSCHHVKVKLRHVHATLFARNQYCSIKHSFADPLFETKLGSQLEAYGSNEGVGIPVSAQVAWSFADPTTARLYVAMDFPWKTFESHWTGWNWKADIAVLGLLYRRDGTSAARFSDTACSVSGEHFATTQVKLHPSPAVREGMKFEIPRRYETQVDVAMGNYTLKLTVTDGATFGRVEIPIEAISYDRKKLTISSVVLCKRFRERRGQTLHEHESLSKYVPLMSKDIDFTPAGNMHFGKNDAMAAYFEINEPLLEADTGTNVQFRLRITSASTGGVKFDSGVRDAMPYAKLGTPIIAVAQNVDIFSGTLSPGAYRIEVQAADSAGKTTDWRTADFTID